MAARYVSIWFRHLATDWFALRQPHLKTVAFVLRDSVHNRMVVTAVNALAVQAGISVGTTLADARVCVSPLEVEDDRPDLRARLLGRLAEWCIRFTPTAAVDLPAGLILDATGCSHLWGGDEAYVGDITKKLQARGYDVRVAMGDTVGAAWAIARYGKGNVIIPTGEHLEALLSLPPEALRIEPGIADRLHKLGLRQIKSFIGMPRASLRRRFGPHFLEQLDKALGQVIDPIEPVQPVELYQERLPCLEPILTATGIRIALEQLLHVLCERLKRDQLGLREAVFRYYRVDGKTGNVMIGTNRPSYSAAHLYKLFESKLTTIEPDLGIELFILEAPKTEDILPDQQAMWQDAGGLEDVRIGELIDRLTARIGSGAIQRFLPSENHWPERSFKAAQNLDDTPAIPWPSADLRPFEILKIPESIEVTAPVPDYPPMLFRYKGKVHTIRKADGPERIEQEWWTQQGQHRDYYRVEDEEGRRYWIFRLGHYDDRHYQWFLHGFFA